MKRNTSLHFLLLAVAAIGVAIVILGLTPSSHAATDPPFGRDLPFKAHGLMLAGDSAGGGGLPATPPASPGSGLSFEVVFLDVGQGDAILVTVGGQRLLIDGGRSSGLALSRLQARGVTALAAVVATHPDADHVGGLAAVLVALPVGRIYVNGDPAETQTYTDFLAAAHAEPGADVVTLARGQSVPLGGLSLPVLNPAAPSGDTNNDSIVLRLACGAVSVLLTGDAEEPAEQSMLTAGLVSHTTVLKAGHHGSRTASSAAFVQAVSPEVAVISAGRTNPYGHPHPEALARLAGAGASFVSTDTTDGDDSVTMTSNCQTYSFSAPPTNSTPIPVTPPATSTQAATPTPTVTLTPAPTQTPGATATQAPVGVTNMSLTSPVSRGAVASLVASTSSNASCTIRYVTPAGTTSTASGLSPKSADGAGNVSWSWAISSNTNPGTGSVTVTCNRQSASASIVIT